MHSDSLAADWWNRFADPYAVLGLAVTANEQQVLKRYRTVAKFVHPDRHVYSDAATQTRANQLLTKLVNPAYEQLRMEYSRRASFANLRQRAKGLTERSGFQPRSELARQLLQQPATGIDRFYEQAVTRLAAMQFEPLTQFEPVTIELEDLNLVYLQLKLSEAPADSENFPATGAAPSVRAIEMPAALARPIESTSIRPRGEDDSYDRRHYGRAQEYVRGSAWDEAIQELKAAIRLNPQQADYHALLGVAYLRRDLSTDKKMAKMHLKRALEIEPMHRLASKHYSACLGQAVSKAANANGDDRHHYRRAQAHIAKKAWDQAVQELKAAIRLDLRRADYHALLGAVYLKIAQETEKLAKVHLKRALKIEPNHPLATEHDVSSDDPDEYDFSWGNELGDDAVGGIAPSPRPRHPRPTIDSDGAMALPDPLPEPPIHSPGQNLSKHRSPTL